MYKATYKSEKYYKKINNLSTHKTVSQNKIFLQYNYWILKLAGIDTRARLFSRKNVGVQIMLTTIAYKIIAIYEVYVPIYPEYPERVEMCNF